MDYLFFLLFFIIIFYLEFTTIFPNRLSKGIFNCSWRFFIILTVSFLCPCKTFETIALSPIIGIKSFCFKSYCSILNFIADIGSGASIK